MHEPRGRTGLDRLLNIRLTAHTLVVVAVVLSVALAGCTGMGGLGDLGGEDDGVAEADSADDGESDGNSGDDAADDGASSDGAGDSDDAGDGSSGAGADDSDGDVGLDSMVGDGADGEWFNLSAPGHYAFDLAGMDEETGEQVTGRLVYDIEDAGNEEVTTSIDYEFGTEQYQSTTTGPADEVMGQLFLTQAHAPVLALQSASLLYYFEMGFTDPSVGNRKQTTVDGQTQVTEVVEERSYAGVDCYFVETTVDGELSQQSCLRGADGGIAPYVATYTEDGDLELEVELANYESR
ncbi:hypothetical protein [Saliphagus infecundisoli]|uniref:Uncharacterized protein n=1 Tax=Saliphagus infecundisoli TaxID=1849069 RepID=A0ABD5QH20_9EURY|nr:hypothetical protein [Saliphagus infecundisoli]